MMMGTTEWYILCLIAVVLAVLIIVRLAAAFPLHRQPAAAPWAYQQTTGNREIQADTVQVFRNQAGTMAVLADGIGKENTGKVAAQVAADTVMDAFVPYHILNNPDYLFRTAFLEAHSRVQQTIGERRGGASMGAVFTDGVQLYYALAGNIRIALFRNGELIPLSKGQTLNVLAKEAYQSGTLSKTETIWSLEATRIWNYLGKDGFHEIEVCKPPVALKKQDLIMLATQGIYDVLSWAELEDVMIKNMTLMEKADQIVRLADSRPGRDKENGSILLLAPEVINEKN